MMNFLTINDLHYKGATPIELALIAHEDQVDKAGAPYIYHPWRVANRVAQQGGSYHQVAAAWLHDTLEDNPAWTADLLYEYVPEGTVQIVLALTRHKHETYSEFIDRVLTVPGAKAVKRADVLDNLAPGRMAQLDQATQDRLTYKYVRALEQLDG